MQACRFDEGGQGMGPWTGFDGGGELEEPSKQWKGEEGWRVSK